MMNKDVRMIIVDDEKPIRDLLKASIDWNGLGVHIVGEASCAQEALELVETQLPDLVFTDICMPMTDGIELSEQIMEKHPGTKIIIITGHDEFDYASRSIKIGIKDFLLKPLDEVEITNVVNKVREDILTERLQKSKYIQMDQYMEENRPHLEERCLNSLIFENSAIEQIKQRLDFLRLSFDNKFFQVAVVEAMDSMTSEDSEEMRLFLSLNCQRMLKEYFAAIQDVYIFFDNSQRNVILCNNSQTRLVDALEGIKMKLITGLKCYISVGIGNSYETMEHIRLSYKQAIKALKYRVIVGNNQIVNHNEIDISSERQMIFSGEQTEDLIGYVKTGQISKVEELINIVFDKQFIGKSLDITPARVAASNILSNVMNILFETGLSDSEIFKDVTDTYERIFKYETIVDIQQSTMNLVVKASLTIDSIKNKRENRIVEGIKGYLSQNYANSTLSLTSVAKHFYLNPSYLSRCFKQGTGITFIEYLTKVRMEEAMRLLRTTDARSYQVAELVGICDPKYFSQGFKRYAGMTINEFKKVSRSN